MFILTMDKDRRLNELQLIFQRLEKRCSLQALKFWGVFICITESEILTQYCAGDKIEKNERSWSCGAYG